ncbi:hypothetical protein L6164_002044 [Bauhinia variegata]|uniref:Uncharacterized protein n=1 Tax=Bauhinia variegata TaxID=167791 RepID=A0ACB9PWG3_BAUVA|nr:hypothetical protein L6164_002044 [Bauhinia variegata]
MRCKKHLSDFSSSVGVCASCLRERLLSLIAAQEQLQAQSARVASRASVAASDDYPRKSDPNPPPISFPRSVSPYVSRRKSDYPGTWQGHDHRGHRLFYSTPQVGPTYYSGDDVVNSGYNGRTKAGSYKRRLGKLWIFSNLFRSRSEKFEQESCEPSSTASPSWFSMIFPAGRKNRMKMGSSEDSVIKERKIHRQADRGMSPATTENFNDNFDGDDRSPSGSGYSSESSPRWRKTPAVAPPSARRSRLGHGRNLTGMAFCLSPLVRASPNRHWNSKPELAPTGETRMTAKPHLSTAASFCANRSRKLADFGRVNQNR